MPSVPFPLMTYDEALERFGSDKPDIRYGMELVDLGSVLVAPDGTPSSGFGVFDTALAAGGRVKAIVAPGMAGVTRRQIDELTERARRFGAKGLAYLDRVKITVGLGRITGTATARVTRAGSGGIRIAVISAGGIPIALLGSMRDTIVPLPALPLGMTIKGVSVTCQGVLVHIAGQNVSFSN